MYELKVVSLFITFKGEELQLLLLSTEKKEILSSWSISLSSVVPELPRSVESELVSKGCSFYDLSSIYLVQKPSRWNSNRLVVTFVRSAGFALPIKIYCLNLEKGSIKDVELFDDAERFWDFLESFKEISWKELQTLYNSCSITNT